MNVELAETSASLSRENMHGMASDVCFSTIAVPGPSSHASVARPVHVLFA